jgi:hypothetical protein
LSSTTRRSHRLPESACTIEVPLLEDRVSPRSSSPRFMWVLRLIRKASRTVSAAFALGIVLIPFGAAAQSPPSQSPRDNFHVFAIAIDIDYLYSHTVYAVASQTGCALNKNCLFLERSTDGGHSWSDMTASGWSGQPVFPAKRGSQRVLLAAGREGLEASLDGGGHFETYSAAKGDIIDVASGAKGGADVLLSYSRPQHMFSLPAESLTQIPGSSLSAPVLRFNPSYPKVNAGQPYALASGVDPSTSFPVVQRCDARLVCAGGSVVETQKSVAKLAISPNFDLDRTLFAATLKGFYRSTDAGTTFTPIVVSPESAQTLITTVQGVAFTPDFNAANGSGSVFAGLLSVAKAASGTGGNIFGGVFQSADGGASWSKVGSQSRLDSGVSALAVAPDGRIFAAYVSPENGRIQGGVLCTTDRKTWRSSCPEYAAAEVPDKTGVPGTSNERIVPRPAQAQSPNGAVSPGATASLLAQKNQSSPEKRSLVTAAVSAALLLAGGFGAILWIKHKISLNKRTHQQQAA